MLKQQQPWEHLFNDQTTSMLPHTAFFDALAALPDAETPEWQALSAGLVILRMIDDWLDGDAQLFSHDSPELLAIRSIIKALPRKQPIKQILGNITFAIEQSSASSIVTVAPGLLSYAQELDRSANYSLAENVLLNIRRRAQQIDAKDILSECGLKLAKNYRLARQFSTAQEFYAEAVHYADQEGDIAKKIRAQCGLTKLYQSTGDTEQAFETIYQAQNMAKQLDHPQYTRMVLHDLAYIHVRNRAFARGLELLQQAIKLPGLDQEQLQCDLADVLLDIGDIALGAEISCFLVVTAKDRRTRWLASLYIMFAAACNRQLEEFQWYLDALGSLAVSKAFQFDYYWVAAQSYGLLGDSEMERTFYQKAYALDNE